MGISLQDTPSADRVHIAFFGRMNSGKSSIINALAGQQVSIVSQTGGTTTDLVRKPMEIHGIGPCILIDTAGFDDEGELGKSRVEKAAQAAQQADVAVFVFDAGTCGLSEIEKQWAAQLRKKGTPVIPVLNKTDKKLPPDRLQELSDAVQAEFGTKPLPVSAITKDGMELLLKKLVSAAQDGMEPERFITGSLVKKDSLVLLVMPQDIQAPKGRLILPQVQTLRELLDIQCVTMCVTTGQLEQALAVLKRPPELIITDSQAFQEVYEKKPAQSMLTSFSVLFAAYKGDIHYFVQGAQAIADLREQDKVLIAECCTHAPLEEDIGRVKLPRLLRKKAGPGLDVQIVSGADFPKDLSQYSLVIQCGACMFNRRHVMSRVAAAREQQVPMTNYGVAIAYLNGILDKIEIK